MFVGYRKGGKKTAYGGIHECQNCKNITNFHLMESSFKPTVMFIPVAKFNVKYYLICSLCERGYELEKEKYNELYRNSFELPNEEDVIPYYNEVDSLFAQDEAKLVYEVNDLMSEGLEENNSNNALEKIYEIIITKIPSSLSIKHKKYIIMKYLNHLYAPTIEKK